MQRIFEALSSGVRRSILAYLAHGELTAGEIMSRFDISKPSVSQHLGILADAGLVRAERRGQYVYYSLIEENLANTLNGFVQLVCPQARPLRQESLELAAARRREARAEEVEPGARVEPAEDKGDGQL